MSREKVIRSEKSLRIKRLEARDYPSLLQALIVVANEKHKKSHTLYSVAMGLGIQRQSIYAIDRKNSFPIFLFVEIKKVLGLDWMEVVQVIESIFNSKHQTLSDER